MEEVAAERSSAVLYLDHKYMNMWRDLSFHAQSWQGARLYRGKFTRTLSDVLVLYHTVQCDTLQYLLLL